VLEQVGKVRARTAGVWARAWVSTPMADEWACATTVTAVGAFQADGCGPAATGRREPESPSPVS
jgi:hypothetical protein